MFNVTICYKSVSRDDKLCTISKIGNVQAVVHEPVHVHMGNSEMTEDYRVVKIFIIKNLFHTKLRWNRKGEKDKMKRITRKR